MADKSTWEGISGQTYEFNTHSTQALFKAVPGVYIFAKDEGKAGADNR